MMRFLKVLIALCALFQMFFLQTVARAQGLALHKALYELNMVAVQSGAGVVGVKGNMFFEQGDACDAWTTDQRFTLEYQYPEQRSVHNTNHYVAWEAKDGTRLEFTSERQENGKVTELLRGHAVKNPNGTGVALYTKPTGLSFQLPSGYLLPSLHTAELIAQAKKGMKISSNVMFDGTDAQGPVRVTAILLKKVTFEDVGVFLQSAHRAQDIDKKLLKSEAWHMRLAVFPLKEDEETMTPSYEMDMILHDNGIVSHAMVDYHSFKIEQKLKTLAAVSRPHCSQ